MAIVMEDPNAASEGHGSVSSDDGYLPASPEPEDNDMSEDDDGKTPRRTTRSSKRPIVASPTQEPPARRFKVDDLVGRLSVHLTRMFMWSTQDACGPCKKNHRDCIPVPDKPGVLTCYSCTQLKVGCTPKAMWAEKREREQKAEKAALMEEQRAAQQAKKEAQKAAKRSLDTQFAETSKQKSKKRTVFGKWCCSRIAGFTDNSQMVLTNWLG